jgi:hypothetical protein
LPSLLKRGSASATSPACLLRGPAPLLLSAVCCSAAGRSNAGTPTAAPLVTRPRVFSALHRRSPFRVRLFKPMSHGKNCPPPRFLRAQTSARACRAEFLPRFCHWPTICSAAARGAVLAGSICSAAARGAVLVGSICSAAARGAVAALVISHLGFQS